jgi:hypothetical protein
MTKVSFRGKRLNHEAFISQIESPILMEIPGFAPRLKTVLPFSEY